MRIRRIAMTCVVLSAGFTTVAPAQSAAEAAVWPPRKPAPPILVEGHPVVAKAVPPSATKAAAAKSSTASVSWPSAGTADVNVTAASEAPLTLAGGLPVFARPSSTAGGTNAAGASSTPGRVRVETLDHASAVARGVDGMLLRVRRSDGKTGAVQVTLGVDYDSFRDAYGGNWASRLRLAQVPTSGPASVLPTHNDLTAGRLTADVSVAETDSTFAMTAGTNGDGGDYGVTSLSPAGRWAVATQSGDFDYTYPLQLPAAPGALKPALTLSYSAQAVDGETSATNNQPSAIGEGWSFWPGSIERGYKSCFDDIAVAADKTGDLCWGTDQGQLLDNATLSLAGHSSPLVNAGNGRWRMKEDDGTRIDRLTGASNGDGGGAEGVGEYWRVTTTDGTQYYFGQNTSSAWTVPVFGNDAAEPCHQSDFDASWCQQAYRWNLDYVVDTHGDEIRYFYTPETNNYGRNRDGAKTTGYVRGGVLEHVEYGGRNGGHATTQVIVQSAERGGADVPSDLSCANGQNCGTHTSPTFWSTKVVSTIKSQVWDGTAYHDADRWTFDHSYPANQDKTAPSLWLQGITHAGLISTGNVTGSSITLPTLTFDGINLPNRLNSDTDGLLPMDKWRINKIANESGGLTQVTYQDTDCLSSAKPDPATNTKRCFPVTWTPDRSSLVHDWMIKYVVQNVSLEDLVGGQPTQVTGYQYPNDNGARPEDNGAGWRLDDDPLISTDKRTYSQFRGFSEVIVTRGDSSKITPSAIRHTYFRGLDGKHVIDSQGGQSVDAEQFAGFERETVTYDGLNGPVVTSAINDVWSRGPSASSVAQPSLKSFVIENGKTVTRTALRATGWRTTEVDRDFNDQGLPITVSDLGDTAVTSDNRCTTTTYAQNTNAWLMDLVSEVRTDAVACGATPSYPQDAIADNRSYYDNHALTDAPRVGDLTRAEELSDFAGTPLKPTFVVSYHGTYDGYGRPLDAYDALNRKTTHAYDPAAGLPTTSSVTNQLGYTTTTSLDVVLGEPVTVMDPNAHQGDPAAVGRTDMTYDALGRRTAVWQPGRSKARGDAASVSYGYGVRADGASWVSTDTLKANNNYVASYELRDGFLRPRQTQSPGEGPNATPLLVVTDTLYDSRGLMVQNNGPYTMKSGVPSNTLLSSTADTEITQLTRVTYDGAERPTTKRLLTTGGQVLTTSTTAYFGDHIEVTPPDGDTPTATYTDARGQMTELRQYYQSATPGGNTYLATDYTYTKAGKLATITDPAGNRWTYTYDLRGRKTDSVDPDKGTTTTTYDDAGQVQTTIDPRKITLAYKYDGIGRKTEEHLDNIVNGTLLASWTYDTIYRGQLTSWTRRVGSDDYTRAITSFDTSYRPIGTRVTIPASLAPLNLNYDTTMTYKPDGSPATVTAPALPGNARETLTYKYDSLGMPYQMTGAKTYVQNTAYTAFGEMSQIQLGVNPNLITQSQVVETYYFEVGTHRLSEAVVERQAPNRAAKVQDLKFAYDPAGNTTRAADTPDDGVSDAQCFTYDRLRRLTDAWTTPTTANSCQAPGTNLGGAAPYWLTYALDNTTGNRTSVRTHAVGATADATQTSDYPAAGQAGPHAVRTVSGLGSYLYDAAGNTTSRPGSAGTQTLTWTPEGGLATVTAAGTTTTNRYDADMNLIASTDGSNITIYLGNAEVHYSPTAGSTSIRYYSFNGSTIAVNTTSGLTWLSHDQNGTENLSIKASDASVVSVRRLDPFGNPRGAQPTLPGSHGFVGGVAQPSGLTHLGAREYDPTQGKFLSVDPVLEPTNPQQLNAYAYANNNPVTMSDPSGLKYFVDQEGYVTAPSLAYWTPSTAGKVAQKIAFYAPYYQKVSAYLQKDCWIPQKLGCPGQHLAAPKVDRPKLTDVIPPPRFECLGGRTTCAYKSPTQGPTGIQSRNGFIAQGFGHGLPQKLIDLLRSSPFKSGSICDGTTAGVILYGSSNTCVNWDSVGITVSVQGGGGIEAGEAFEESISLKLNTDSADSVSKGLSVNAAAGPSFAWGGGGGVQGEVEWNFTQGNGSASVSVEANFGEGLEFGSISVNGGFNFGYVLKWCDVGLC